MDGVSPQSGLEIGMDADEQTNAVARPWDQEGEKRIIHLERPWRGWKL